VFGIPGSRDAVTIADGENDKDSEKAGIPKYAQRAKPPVLAEGCSQVLLARPAISTFISVPSLLGRRNLPSDLWCSVARLSGRGGG
jgi:hypothetical protein